MQVVLELIEFSEKYSIDCVLFTHKPEPKVQVPERNIKRANMNKNNHFPNHGAEI